MSVHLLFFAWHIEMQLLGHHLVLLLLHHMLLLVLMWVSGILLFLNLSRYPFKTNASTTPFH